MEAAAMDDAAAGEEKVRVRRETLRAALDQYRRVFLLLQAEAEAADAVPAPEAEDDEPPTPRSPSSASTAADREADELCDLLKSKVESPEFLEKLGSIHMSVSKNISGEESSSWDLVTATDLWEDKHGDGSDGSDQGDYVLVNQEDIVEGMACFMAAYLLSLNQTKELTPNQLQEALSKTFSAKKKKSKLRKAWDGSKVIYNVASWGATAIGIYQNPALLQAASVAFWSSCRAISKLL